MKYFFLCRHLLSKVVLDLDKYTFPFADMFYYWDHVRLRSSYIPVMRGKETVGFYAITCSVIHQF